MPVRLLPFFVEIQNARVWPFVIPPVRSARLQDVFPYGNCTETVRKPGKYEGAHLRGFRTMGSPWEHTLFSVTYRQRGANCACYIGVLPALLSVGFSGGRNVRKIQNYLSGEATRTFRYPRSQVFRDFENLCGIPVNAAAAFVGKNAPYCPNATPYQGITIAAHLSGKGSPQSIRGETLIVSPYRCAFG